MGLKEILDALEHEADNAIKDVQQRAVAQAQRIKEDSVRRAEEAKQEIIASETKKIEQESKNIIYAAEAEGRKLISKAREEVFSLARQKLEDLIKNDGEIRQKVFKVALEDSISSLGSFSSEVEIAVSESDKPLVEEFLKEKELEARVVNSPEISDGFVVRAQGGKVSIVVNAAVISERLMKQYTAEISERLFG